MHTVGEGLVVVPDIHGRYFWREAADRADGKHIVFLGDYGDPFPEEGIPAEQALKGLEDILARKRSLPEKTTLLLGNHDLQYLWPDFPKRRYDTANARYYSSLIRENRDCFDLIASFHAQNRVVVLTHAGILPEWLKANPTLFGIVGELPLYNGPTVADFDRPNALWREGADTLLCEALSSESALRGGHSPYGSMVWADVSEMRAVPVPLDVFQVFGHSRQHGSPFVTDSFACVDCSRAFLLDNNGVLSAFPQ